MNWKSELYLQHIISSTFVSGLEEHPRLHLPGPNPFIATDFSIKDPDSQSKVWAVPWFNWLDYL